MMMNDPIVEEIHQVRRKMMEECDCCAQFMGKMKAGIGGRGMKADAGASGKE